MNKVVDLSGVTHPQSDNSVNNVTLVEEGTLEVVLSAVPSSGYCWEIDSLPTALKLVGEFDEGSPVKFAGEELVGGEIKTYFRFLFTKKTKGILKFKYFRPWADKPLRFAEIKLNH